MTHNPHHEHLIAEIKELFEPLLTNSKQAIYISLDDEHKICNSKFADLLGYKSTQELTNEEQNITMSLERFNETIDFTREAGFDKGYFR